MATAELSYLNVKLSYLLVLRLVLRPLLWLRRLCLRVTSWKVKLSYFMV